MDQKQNKRFLTIKPYMVWGILILFYFTVGMQSSFLKGIYFSVLFTFIQFVVYTANQKLLIPLFFETNKQKFYLFNFVGLLIFTLITTLTDVFLLSRYFIPSRPSSLIFPFFLHTILGLVASWISISQYLLEKEKRTKIEIEELKREKAESELKFLKMQINPHFLFNAMNNIYTMAYTGDSSAPEKIAMLSDMLRYVLYECESDFISLRKEIEYINSYIEFQQMKTEREQNISFIHDNCSEDYLIGPMLLIPFIENSFKHSKIERDKSAYVRIELTQTQNKFTFRIVNSYPEFASASKISKEKGIGIENVRSRLELLYAGKYNLEVEKKSGEHSVFLELYK
jgi:sensor histidine kinase YesM